MFVVAILGIKKKKKKEWGGSYQWKEAVMELITV